MYNLHIILHLETNFSYTYPRYGPFVPTINENIVIHYILLPRKTKMFGLLPKIKQ